MKMPTELEVARGQGRRCSIRGRGVAKCVLGPSVCLCVPPTHSAGHVPAFIF